MATIREILAYAPIEARQFFLLRCDEGMHEAACVWLREELEASLEADLDYAKLRERAAVQVANSLGEDLPSEPAEERLRQSRFFSSVRECWYCSESIHAEQVNCPRCGRNQRDGGV